jgi:hypothetical protein
VGCFERDVSRETLDKRDVSHETFSTYPGTPDFDIQETFANMLVKRKKDSICSPGEVITWTSPLTDADNLQ